MKRIFTLLSLSMLGMGAFAQTNAAFRYQVPQIGTEMLKSGHGATTSDLSQRAPLDTIPGMYWDFAGGLPSGWTAVDVSGNGAWQFSTQAPQGQFSGGAGIIQSTTRANGFMILDGDFYNPSPSPNAPPSSNPMDAYFQTPVLNLSEYNDVLLRFQQYFRFCCSAATINIRVQVSNDGGATFTDYDVRGNVPVNAFSPNADRVELNISSVVANQSNVVIRFRVSGASHYFWIVDDVALVQAADNDLKLRRRFVDFFFPDGGYYTRLPFTQLGPITFRGAVFNNGANAQSNVRFQVGVNKGSQNVYQQSSVPVASFPRLGLDTLSITTPFTPDEMANYTFSFNLLQNETDQNPSDNTLPSVSFTVNDTVFARDNGITAGAQRLSTNNYIGGDVDGSRIATLYECINPGELSSISVYVATPPANSASIGAAFKGIVYRFTSTGIVPVLETEIYDIINNGNLGRWVHLPFITDGLNEFIPDDGADYLVGIEVLNVTANRNVYLLAETATQQPNATTFIFIAGATNPTWGWINVSQPFIRLNLKSAFVSVPSIADVFEQLEISPNPSNDRFAVQLGLGETLPLSYRLTQITGQVVMESNLGLMPKGEHRLELNTAHLPAGIYTLSLITPKGIVARKVAVKH